jgi:hypothetical protein
MSLLLFCLLRIKDAPMRFTSPSVKTALSVSLVASFLLPVMAMAASFVDVSSTNWAAPAIGQLSDAKILGGYPTGEFKPEGRITRAEFAAVLSKAIGLPPQAPQGLFSDVATSNWAAPAVESIKRSGVMGGYPNGTFAPAKQISRTEAMITLASAARLPLPSDTEAAQILSQFRDGSQVPAWASRSVAAAVKSGLVRNQPNMPGMLAPNAMATRADVAFLTDGYLAFSSGNGAMATPVAQAPLQGRVVMLPAKTKFTGTIQAGLDSETTQVGSLVALTLPQGIASTDGASAVIPAGSTITGRVTKVTPTGLAGRHGSLELRFDTLQLPDGRQAPLQASIATESHMLVGGSTAGRLLKVGAKTAIGAGLGAGLGTAMGALSGGKVGKGAIYGTAIGTGLGATAAVIGKGEPVALQAGEQLEIQLDSPLTLDKVQ